MGACGRAKSRSLPTRRDAVAIDGSSTAASCYGRGLDFPIRTHARGLQGGTIPCTLWAAPALGLFIAEGLFFSPWGEIKRRKLPPCHSSP